MEEFNKTRERIHDEMLEAQMKKELATVMQNIREQRERDGEAFLDRSEDISMGRPRYNSGDI